MIGRLRYVVATGVLLDDVASVVNYLDEIGRDRSLIVSGQLICDVLDAVADVSNEFSSYIVVKCLNMRCDASRSLWVMFED